MDKMKTIIIVILVVFIVLVFTVLIIKRLSNSSAPGGDDWAVQELENEYGPMGDTIDELLANEGAVENYKIILALEYNIDKKAKLKGNASLSDLEKQIVAISGLQREVNNGGFDQYFYNSAGNNAAYALAGLSEMGAVQTNSLLKKAVAEFPSSQVPVNREKRYALMVTIDEKSGPIWSALDTEFYQLSEPIDDLLLQYIKKNKDDISL
jgi:Domain of unknown function (DUF4375)